MLFYLCPRTLRTPKFWHTYVITHGDFMVIVELWHGPDNFQKLAYESCRNNTQVHLQFLCKPKLQLRQKGGAATQIDSVIAPVLQVKFRFTSCLIKGNALISGRRSSLSSQLIVLLFLRNSHLQRDILANIFSPVFS